MSATWFAVLSQSQMKIFHRPSYREPFKHLRTFRNLLVDIKGLDLVSHRAGAKSKARGASRAMLTSKITPHQQIVRDFTHRMAAFLGKARKTQKFGELFVAAEPRSLGLLKKAMDPNTKKSVRNWVSKDLEKADVDRLAEAFLI